MIQKGNHLGPQTRQQLTQLNQLNKNYQLQSRTYPLYQKEYQTKNSRLRSQIVNPQSIEKVPPTPQNQIAKETLDRINRINQNFQNNTNSQIIILNDRKFIKNRTPQNLRYNSPQNCSTHKQQIDPWIKIRILENRIVQLNRQKQMEMINLVNKNIQIKKQLQNQRQKSHILLNNTNSWIQTSKIAINDNNYPPNIQTQTLYRIIQQLQQSLQKVTKQNKNLLSKNKNISEQIETFVKILITQKQIQNQNLSNRSRYVQDKSALESRIRSLEQQNKSFKSQILHMQRQNMRIREQYKQKQSQLQNIYSKTLHQNNKLHKKCQQLQQKLNSQQIKNTNLEQKIRKNHEKQKQSSYSNNRNRQLILINQVQDGSFLKINSTITQKQQPNQLTEDNLSNIIQKMQILTHNNDSIVQENQMLRNKINQLIKQNVHLKNISQIINGKRLSKQFLDAKINQNNLQTSQGSIPNMNQNNQKSMLESKNFSLELSAATLYPKKKEQNCTKCKELVQLLFRLRNQIGLKSCVEKKTW